MIKIDVVGQVQVGNTRESPSRYPNSNWSIAFWFINFG